jgi:hypothetical protein
VPFLRPSAGKFSVPADYLVGAYGSAGGSACCILGSGCSVKDKLSLLSRQLRANQISPFSINWGGFDKTGWSCYPCFWTSCDSPDRFSSQLFRDPSVTKFVPKERQHDWISGRDFTVSECPNVFGLDRATKGLETFFGSGPIIDGRDSFVQAIDIAIRLGFKRIYLAGCDLFIGMTDTQVEWLSKQLEQPFILGNAQFSIWDAIEQVSRRTGILASRLIAEFKRLGDLEAYAFGNAGTNWEKAVRMDHHCFASANLLVQSRRLLDTLGVSVILLDDFTSPIGRLRRFFPSVKLTTSETDSPPDYSRPSLGVAIHVKPYTGEGVKREETTEQK